MIFKEIIRNHSLRSNVRVRPRLGTRTQNAPSALQTPPSSLQLPPQRLSRTLVPSTPPQSPRALSAPSIQDALPRNRPIMAHAVHSPPQSAPLNGAPLPLSPFPTPHPIPSSSNGITDTHNNKIHHQTPGRPLQSQATKDKSLIHHPQ